MNRGLGIRKLEDHNTSFLLKLGFHLITKEKALWVQVLRSKYKLKKQIPTILTQGNCPPIWRGTAKVRPLLKVNLGWAIGTREVIQSWEDSWLPNTRPLKALARSLEGIPMVCYLKDTVFTDGSWNLQAFRDHLLEDVARKIVSISPPHPMVILDKVIWLHSPTGRFSVKSAYQKVKEDTWHERAGIWKFPWRYQGPHRI